ncbi:uncharacterized protein LOC128236088 isoform X6 [Mya arenaria]|uniref:uncharacterized protein LOC128236088 isoform X6 n=1 Tax=Mya arenaria TaxID=6604 RepID=UPI0022E76B86|nr:uncharacterized protein LOC128236088 isoform X6 [Mya arenaria]
MFSRCSDTTMDILNVLKQQSLDRPTSQASIEGKYRLQMMLILTKPAAIVPLINLFMTMLMIYMRFHLQCLAVLLDRPIQLQRDLPY